MNSLPRNLAGLAAVVLCGASLSSCRKPVDTVKSDLGEAGYELTAEGWFRASRENDLSAMRKFVEAGFKIDTKDAEGRSALHVAAEAGAMGTADYLLDRGVPVDVTDPAGRTPLMAAVIAKQTEMTRWLLKQGADPRLKDSEGFKPLMLAVREGSSGPVSELAAYDRSDLDNALLLAALVGRTDVIDSLTNYGASVYARMEDGRTPLMIAAENGHEGAVELLMDLGASRFAVDSEGRTAAEIATAAGHTGIAAMLLREPTASEFALESPEDVAEEMDSYVDGAIAKADGSSSSKGGGGSPKARPRAAAVSINGATLGAPVARGGDDRVREGDDSFDMPPLVMRHYREKEVPVHVKRIEGDSAIISVAGTGTRDIQVRKGGKIPGTNLVVVSMRKRMVDSKMSLGQLEEISVVEIQDPANGTSREWISGVPSQAHDPVALVEDSSTGNRYVAAPGQRFKGEDGTEYFISDVRPNQMVIRESATGAVRTIPLRGPRG